MSELVEITGTITKFFKDCPKDNGWFGCYFKLENGLQVKMTGVCKNIELDTGKVYDVLADKESSPKYGDQYTVKHISNSTKSMSSKEIIRYFSSSLFDGIGKATAIKLYKEFGRDIYDVIENEPDKLRAIGISEKKIVILQNGVQSNTTYGRILRVAPMLSDKVVDNLISSFGRKAADYLTDNPYDILYMEPKVVGYTFKLADQIALGNGMDKSDARRVKECMKYACHEFCTDYACSYLNLSDMTEYQQYLKASMELIDSTQVHARNVEDYITEFLKKPVKGLIVEECDTQYHMYVEDKHEVEKQLAFSLAMMIKSEGKFKNNHKELNRLLDEYCTNLPKDRRLDQEQIAAIKMALTNKISVITGGPGRGKTTVLEAVIRIWEQLTHKEPVLLAPTGKAVCRLNEATGKTNGMTVARMIFRSMMPSTAAQDERLFAGNLVIVDECSMIGMRTALDMIHLFNDSFVVLVGDVDQLPSIEYGQFFKDVCKTPSMPKTRLLVNHRGTGLIVPNADKINRGMIAEKLDWDYINQSFVLYQYNEDNTKFTDHIVSEYMEKITKNGKVDYKAMKDVCILCPSQKYTTGSRFINYILQEKLNPEKPSAGMKDRGYMIPGTVYKINDVTLTNLRVGDRVIYTKNHPDFVYRKKESDGTVIKDCGIANGDCGLITGVKKELITVDGFTDFDYIIQFYTDDGREFEIESQYFEEFELAYAITIHKSQGSEYKTVIISAMCVLTNWGNFSNRNLMYTAVTRAKLNLIIVGSVDAFNKCILTVAMERNSALSDKIEAFANIILEEEN